MIAIRLYGQQGITYICRLLTVVKCSVELTSDRYNILAES